MTDLQVPLRSKDVSLQELATLLTEVRIMVMREDFQRHKVKETKEFTDLTDQMTDVLKKQEQLLETVPNHGLELDHLKKLIINKMQQEGRKVFDNIEAKFRKKKEVDIVKTLHVLGGDMDNFCLIAKISQKDLKEFGDSNPEYKKGFRDCVNIVSEELTDVVIHLPD